MRLSDPRYENRLRITLAHECGHVWLHAPLWRKPVSKSDRRSTARSWRCEDKTIVAPQRLDGMAGGLCLRRPVDARSEILPLTKNFAGTDENNFSSNSDFGRATIGWIARRCPLNRNRQNRSIFATITSNGSSERFHPWFAYRPLRSTIFVSMQSCSRNLEPSVFRT